MVCGGRGGGRESRVGLDSGDDQLKGMRSGGRSGISEGRQDKNGGQVEMDELNSVYNIYIFKKESVRWQFEVSFSDEPTEIYHSSLQRSSALQSIVASLS